MGKFKESFSTLYYNSQEDFFTAVETGENEPSYIGLLEIVRVLKLINGNKKKIEIPTPISPKKPIGSQLTFIDKAI